MLSEARKAQRRERYALNRERMRAENNLYYKNSWKRRREDTLKRRLKIITSSFETFLKQLMMTSNRRNKNKGFDLKFEVDLQYLIDLLKRQNYKCAISNVQLTHKYHDLHSISIDRIDSNLGYINGNIQLVCKAMNLAKNSHSNQEMLELIEEIKCQN